MASGDTGPTSPGTEGEGMGPGPTNLAQTLPVLLTAGIASHSSASARVCVCVCACAGPCGLGQATRTRGKSLSRGDSLVPHRGKGSSGHLHPSAWRDGGSRVCALWVLTGLGRPRARLAGRPLFLPSASAGPAHVWFWKPDLPVETAGHAVLIYTKNPHKGPEELALVLHLNCFSSVAACVPACSLCAICVHPVCWSSGW